MRLVYVLLFFLTMPVQHFIVTRVHAPDVTITDVGWTTPPAHQTTSATSKQQDSLIDMRYNDVPQPRTTSQNPLERSRPDKDIIGGPVPSSPPRAAADTKPAIFIGVKNSGSRDIRAISWEVIFSDRNMADEYLHLKFETKQRVPSGESLMLNRKFRNEPAWERLQQAVQNQSAAVTVKITGLQYADGTSWKP